MVQTKLPVVCEESNGTVSASQRLRPPEPNPEKLAIGTYLVCKTMIRGCELTSWALICPLRALVSKLKHRRPQGRRRRAHHLSDLCRDKATQPGHRRAYLACSGTRTDLRAKDLEDAWCIAPLAVSCERFSTVTATAKRKQEMVRIN